MLDRRRRRRASIKLALGQRLLFVHGWSDPFSCNTKSAAICRIQASIGTATAQHLCFLGERGAGLLCPQGGPYKRHMSWYLSRGLPTSYIDLYLHFVYNK